MQVFARRSPAWHGRPRRRAHAWKMPRQSTGERSVKRPRVTDVVLVLLCLMYFVTYLDRVNVSSAAAGFSKDFGLNKTEIGLVFSAFAYPYLVFQIIGGWISDRFGA